MDRAESFCNSLVQNYYFNSEIPFSDEEIFSILTSDAGQKAVLKFLNDRNHFGFLIFASIYIRRFLELSSHLLILKLSECDAILISDTLAKQQARIAEKRADYAGVGVAFGGFVASFAASEIAKNAGEITISALASAIANVSVDVAVAGGVGTTIMVGSWLIRQHYKSQAQKLRDGVPLPIAQPPERIGPTDQELLLVCDASLSHYSSSLSRMIFSRDERSRQ